MRFLPCAEPEGRGGIALRGEEVSPADLGKDIFYVWIGVL
jgi:hypothetical protein